MGSFGGFYKGEKRKQKKGKETGVKIGFSTKPTFTLPDIISKKRKDY